jgi:hypothetical protein
MRDPFDDTDVGLLAAAMEAERNMPPVAHPPAHWHPRVKLAVYAPQLSGPWQSEARLVLGEHFRSEQDTERAYGFTGIFGDETEGAEPMLGVRTDGQPLFYRYAYNMLWGPPQARKSWVAILAIKQVIAEWPWPQRCVYFDYEDNAQHFSQRLRLVGCEPEHLRRPDSHSRDGKGWSWVDYRSSPGDLRPDLVDSEFSMLGSFRGIDSPAIIVIDGVAAFCAAHGCESNSNDDWGTITDEVLTPLCTSGAAIILIDHVPKSGDGSPAYPIGASQKLARCRGAGYAVSSVSDTVSKLVLQKDTNGQVAAAVGSTVAELVLEESGVYSPQLHLRVPNGAKVAPPRLEELMERGSRALEQEDGLITRELRARIGGRKEKADEAMEQLEADGYIRTAPQGRAVLHHLIKPYRRP